MKQLQTMTPGDRELWQVLAQAKLRLAPDVNFYSQTHRDKKWVVVQNTAKNQFFKTTYFVKNLLLQLDGLRTLQNVLDADPVLHELLLEESTYVALLAKLIESGVVISDLPIDHQKELTKKKLQDKQKNQQKWLKPWFYKQPLFNPDRTLTQLNSVLGFIWSKPIFYLWLLFVIVTCASAWDYSADLKHYWQVRFLEPINLLLAACLYPLLKILHELGHGLSTKKWGGHVYETGVALLFFMPVPYVDASSSVAFSNKYQRMVVSAAGIMTELFMASVAFWVWLNVDSLLLRDICFNVMLIGAVSSLFFNGNPLLKYDGYYILCDLIEIPNLSQRAQHSIDVLFKRFALRVDVQVDYETNRERAWLIGYGVLSGLYRAFIAFAIAFFIMSKYFWLGLILGFWALCTQVFLPVTKWMARIFSFAKSHGARAKLGFSLGFMLVSAGLIVGVLPIKNVDSAYGIVEVSGEQQIKAEADGFVKSVSVEAGQWVEQGHLLFTLENSTLTEQIALLEARVAEAKLQVAYNLSEDPSQLEFFKSQLKNLEQELADAVEQSSGLLVKSTHAGFIQFVQNGPFEGQYFQRGQLLGVIINKDYQAQLTLSELQVFRLQGQQAVVEVRLDSQPNLPLTVLNTQLTPSATNKIPNKFLSVQYGGRQATDINSEDELTSINPLFVMTLSLNSDEHLRVGSRLTARFVYSSAPIGWRLYAYIRRQALAHLGL